jgi:hypothetical protein
VSLYREPIATVVEEVATDWTRTPSTDEAKGKKKKQGRNMQLRNNNYEA